MYIYIVRRHQRPLAHTSGVSGLKGKRVKVAHLI